LGYGVTTVSGIPSGYKLNDFYEYDPQLNSWTRKEDIPNSNLEVSFFGTTSKGFVLNSNMQLFEFDPKLNNWVQKNDFPGSPRTAALGISIGDTGYVFGGADNIPVNGLYVYLKDMWAYNSVNDTWTSNNDFTGPERTTRIGLTIGNKMFIGDGFNRTHHLFDWWEYNSSIF
jgi:N-acetylneuraminic acid mutarotase